MKFRTGNIVKEFNGSVIIVSNVTDNHVQWISATHGNSCGTTPQKTTEEIDDCECTEFGCYEPEIDCPHCQGSGKIKKIRYGMDNATYLADNMFEYIKNRMLKNFDF